MAEYDTISKHLIQTYPKDFIRFTLERDDIEVLDILDTEQTTVEARHADSLIRVHIAGKEALIHHEFQTTDSNEPPMPFRMAGYIGRAIEHHRLPIYSSVIYLRHGAGRHDPGHYIQGLPGHRVVVEYKVIRLSETEGQDIIDGGHAGLLPFASLMKRPAGTDSEAWLRRCIHATNALPLDASIKVDILGSLAILSGLEYASTTINRILSQEGLMDAIMRESSFAQYIKQQAREEGIEQGNRERAIEDILDVLEIRFSLSVAHSLSDRLAAIDDLQRLKQLHRAAIKVSSLEAFQQALDE
ncbi:MAG: hypothetical protein OXI94_10770 [Gemmatimonadota bacterium]|nr:hypothetical protein [Gemmatimonadota bacterium]MDE2955269.1 hypothetical protein [Gemmatimonadota bacterium]